MSDHHHDNHHDNHHDGVEGRGHDRPPAVPGDDRVVTAGYEPVRNPAVAEVAVGGSLVITHPRARRAVALDPVTAQLWRWFEPGLTVGELADDVADALALDPDEALATLTTVVHDLGVAGYLAEDGEDRFLRIERFPTIPPDT